MSLLRHRLLPCLIPLLLCSAEEAVDCLRAGNGAFHRGDHQTALQHYARALSTTTDPGRVMFQQAAAHAALLQDGQAATAYLRCLEDAQGVRRVLALYGRGNALAQVGNLRQGRVAVGVLKEALTCLEQSLTAFGQLPAQERARLPRHADDVTHNLGVVKQLLSVKEKEAAAQPEEPPPEAQHKPPTPDQPDPAADEKPGQGTPPSPGNGDNPRATDQSRPGRGQLPLLLDDKNAPPLTAEQAQEYLQQTLDRLQQHRRQGQAPPPPGARDW